jgi:hypothetical protein
MKSKLKDHVDLLFADAEGRALADDGRLAELKESILSELYEKYDALIAGGKTPTAAYSIAVAELGDITERVAVCASPEGGDSKRRSDCGRALTPNEQETVQKYQKRAALLSSLSVALYILCWVPLVVLGALPDDIGGMLGLVIMFLMIAAATAMNVYKGMSKPHFDGMTQWERDNGKSCKDDDNADDGDEEEDSSAAGQTLPRRSPVYGVISSVLWALTLGAYLLCSFLTDAWHITWMIFLIATALDNVIKAIFDLRR